MTVPARVRTIRWMIVLMAEPTDGDDRTRRLRDDSPLGHEDDWMLLKRGGGWQDLLLDVRDDYVLRAYRHIGAHRCRNVRHLPVSLILIHEDARLHLADLGLTSERDPETYRVFAALRSVFTWYHAVHVNSAAEDHINDALRRILARDEFSASTLDAVQKALQRAIPLHHPEG